MVNPIPSEQLTENTYIVVDGYVDYSHVTSLIEGETLAKRNEGRLYPIRDPYTAISLRDARIRPASGDPNNLSIEEQYVQNSFYNSKKDPSKINMCSIDNKSQQLPAIYEPKDPNDLSQGYEQVIEPAGELDRDLSATLVLQVYKPQNYEKRGIGLRLININEPIRYFSGGVDMNHLQSLGIVLNNAPAPTVASAPMDNGNAGAQGYTDYSSGQGLPTPGIGGNQAPQHPVQPQQGYQAPAPQNQQQQGYHAPAPQTHQPAQNQPQQGYQQQGNQPVQPQQGYQAPAPQAQQPAQNQPQGYAQPQAQPQQGYQQPIQNQQVPSPAQPGQSAFDAGAAPMNQQANQYAQPQGGQDPETQSPWAMAQPGMHYQP